MFSCLKWLFFPLLLIEQFFVLSLGGSSKSSSASTVKTSALDARQAVDSGVAIGNHVNGAQALDNGIALNLNLSASGKNSVGAKPVFNITTENLTDDVVYAALGSVDKANALAGQSLDDVLKLASSVFDRGSLITQQAMQQTGAAYDVLLARKNEADIQESGALDNRTVVVLAVAGLAAVVLLRKR